MGCGLRWLNQTSYQPCRETIPSSGRAKRDDNDDKNPPYHASALLRVVGAGSVFKLSAVYGRSALVKPPPFRWLQEGDP